MKYSLFKKTFFLYSLHLGFLRFLLYDGNFLVVDEQSFRLVVFVVRRGEEFAVEKKPKIRCFFENSAVKYFTFSALHSAEKFSNEQQIFGLRSENWTPDSQRISWS